MSVWTTKSIQNHSRDYIVFKHALPGINYVVKGVKFRNGYAVVEKNSKTYSELKKIPVLRKAQEFPITHLRKLPFITRTVDVKTVYGHDVYIYFLEKEQILKEAIEAEKIEVEEKQHIADPTACNYRTDDGDLCSNFAMEKSPSGYCKMHILKDPGLIELGIEVPKFLTKNEKKELRQSIVNKLEG